MHGASPMYTPSWKQIPGLSSFKFAKPPAAIEQRRLSPVETEEERRALEIAWEGVRALISETAMKLV